MRFFVVCIGISASILLGVYFLAGWIYRDNLASLMGLPYSYDGGNKALGEHSFDEQVVLSMAGWASARLMELAEERPHDPTLWALVARHSWSTHHPFVHEGGRNHELDAETRRIEALQRVLVAGERGATVDPDNGFFPLVKAAAYAQLDDLDSAISELILASSKSNYDDYIHEAIQLRISVTEQRYGYRGEFARAMIHASEILPHLAELRDLSRTIFALGQSQEAITARAAMAKSLYMMFISPGTPIDDVVALTSFRRLAGSEIEITKALVGGEQRVEVVDAIERFQRQTESIGLAQFNYVAAEEEMTRGYEAFVSRPAAGVEEPPEPTASRLPSRTLLLMPLSLLAATVGLLLSARQNLIVIPALVAAGASIMIMPVHDLGLVMFLAFASVAIAGKVSRFRRWALWAGVTLALATLILAAFTAYAFGDLDPIILPPLSLLLLLSLAYVRRNVETDGLPALAGVVTAAALLLIIALVHSGQSFFHTPDTLSYISASPTPRDYILSAILAGLITLVLLTLWWNTSPRKTSRHILRAWPLTFLVLVVAFLIGSGIDVRRNEEWRAGLETMWLGPSEFR